MSDLDRTEVRELRARLKGTQQDLEHERGRVAAGEITIRAQDARLEYLAAELDKLRGEKRLFWDFALEVPDELRMAAQHVLGTKAGNPGATGIDPSEGLEDIGPISSPCRCIRAEEGYHDIVCSRTNNTLAVGPTPNEHPSC